MMCLRIPCHTWVLFALLPACLMHLDCEVARGQDGARRVPDKQDSDTQKLQTALQKLEALIEEIEPELVRREEHAKRSPEALAAYRQELTDEYHANARKLDRPLGEDGKIEDTAKLERRQKVIALHLWELQRIEPEIELRAVPIDDLQEKFHTQMRLLVPRELMNDREIQERVNRFQERLRESEGRHRMMANMANMQRVRHEGFYEVRPIPEDHIDLVEDEVPPLAEDLMHVLRPSLRRMLKLTWNGGHLALDRGHWLDLFAGKTLTEVGEEVESEFKDRGAEIVRSDRSPFGFRRNNETSPAVLLFQNVKYNASQFDQKRNNGQSRGASESGGGAGGRRRVSFGLSDFEAYLELNETDFEIELREYAGSERTIRFTAEGDGALRFSMTGERILYLEQQSDGDARLVEIFGDELFHATGETFAKLYAAYPEFVEVSLFPLLDQLGFIVPETRFSPAVMQRVVELLRARHADSEERFQQLLEHLDSPNHVVRDAADRELQAHRGLYLDAVKEAFPNQELSLEVRLRLKRFLELHDHQTGRPDAFVATMKLLDDPQYLVNILPLLPRADVSVCAGRLETLTGESFGDDIEAWQVWLASNSKASSEVVRNQPATDSQTQDSSQ